MNKPYDPQLTCFPYTEQTDGHYLVVKKNDHAVFDKNFVYVDKSKKFKFWRGCMNVVTALVAFPVSAIRQGLRIEGRKNLKKHKELLKNGAVSVANHVHIWDYIAIMNAVWPIHPYHPSWATNCRGENKILIRYNGGIPVPENDMRAMAQFSKAVEQLLNEGGWYHTYAEGSMWEYYQPIRPFKKGAFRFAVKTGKPVVPMAFSYRKARGLRRLFCSRPTLTLRVGEPILPDTSLPHAQAIEKLCIECHQAVCRLAGIADGENIYPPIFQNNKRIDYYPFPTKEE